MRQYETMVLLSPELTDETVEEKISGFENKVAEGGGEVLNVDRWGRSVSPIPSTASVTASISSSHIIRNRESWRTSSAICASMRRRGAT